MFDILSCYLAYSKKKRESSAYYPPSATQHIISIYKPPPYDTLSTSGPASLIFSTNSTLTPKLTAPFNALATSVSALSLTNLLSALIRNAPKTSTLHSSGITSKTSATSNQPLKRSSNSPVRSMRCEISPRRRNSCSRKLKSRDCSARLGSSACGM
jgi:hypothetical protein